MRLVIVLLIALLMPLSASAQFIQPLPENISRNPQVMQGLLKVINMPPDIQTTPGGNKLDMSVTATRGGNGSAHPLGLYGLGQDIEFRSPYKDLDPGTMAKFAYDLNEHTVNAGGGWENYLRYRQQDAQRSSQQPDAMDRSIIPYNKLYDWTRTYWDHYSEKFRRQNPVMRQWWVNDAILDGLHLYFEYQQRLAGQASADFVCYKDAVLAAMIKQK